jgi:DNA repair exonuclease SbcCD ATPase subunit
MANLTHREATRVGLAGMPQLPPDETPRDGRADDLDRSRDGGLETSRMSASMSANAPAGDEPSALRIENEDLRRRVEELEHVLLASGDSDDAAAEAQREFERLLEQKSETIRDLHQQLQELRAQVAAAGDDGAAHAVMPSDLVTQAGPSHEEAQAQRREIAEERSRMEEERQQLKDDEESLMKQMREMELSLSRDRADLARQRTELQRLQNDLNRELEQAGRDAGLRDRLLSLRRTQEAPAANHAPANHAPAARDPAAAAPASIPTPPEPAPSIKKSGLLRRIFGG